MTDPLTNLVEKTGRSMPEWTDVVATSGQIKHTDIMGWLKTSTA